METSNKLFDHIRLKQIDSDHIWHPYTQAKIAESPLLVEKAENEFLYIRDEKGEEKKIIDGISSWWVNIHGHNHPYINQAVKDQLDKFEHVIFAGFTHEASIRLVEKLLPILPQHDITISSSRNFASNKLSKAFFSDNGSTAVEVGLKMAVQYFHNQGSVNKNRIIAFKDSYHGDTIGCMSTSDTPIFHQAFKSILIPIDFIRSPSPQKKENGELETSEEAVAATIASLEKLYEMHPNKHAAAIIEPLVQGAGGMKFHSPKFLQELKKFCQRSEILMVADEVFTGFGRTGKNFACEHAMIIPDIICLSKALTGGYLPMGLTVTNDNVYQAFHSESKLKTFFHGHSFTGNPLSCAAALASLELYKKEQRLDKDVSFINRRMREELNCSELREHERIADIRILGALAVIEIRDDGSSYLNSIGKELCDEFLRRHILIRPLGNVVYFLPPYTISSKSFDYSLDTIKAVLLEML